MDLGRPISQQERETRELEYKSRRAEYDDITRELVAFANTVGGVLILGVREENGDIKEIQNIDAPQDVEEGIQNVINSSVEPAIEVQSEISEIDEKTIIGFLVKQSDRLHSIKISGRPCFPYRQGSRTTYLNGYEIEDRFDRFQANFGGGDIRKEHTETLKDRVKKWHGNPEKDPPEDLTQGPSKNLPTVYGATIKSAQNVGITLEGLGREEEFHSVPRELRDDPYFVDLLENHAPDLRKTKTRIEELQSEFSSLRKQFLDRYDHGIVEEEGDYRLEPDSLLAEWIFDLVVLSARGRIYGDDTILDRALSDIENNDMSPLVPDESKLRFYADLGRQAVAVYFAVFEEADAGKLREYRDDVEQKVMGTVEKVVENIDDREPYSYAREAADVLDSAEAQVNKLDELLIEYYGRPIYSGDCEYLEEARI